MDYFNVKFTAGELYSAFRNLCQSSITITVDSPHLINIDDPDNHKNYSKFTNREVIADPKNKESIEYLVERGIRYGHPFIFKLKFECIQKRCIDNVVKTLEILLVKIVDSGKYKFIHGIDILFLDMGNMSADMCNHFETLISRLQNLQYAALQVTPQWDTLFSNIIQKNTIKCLILKYNNGSYVEKFKESYTKIVENFRTVIVDGEISSIQEIVFDFYYEEFDETEIQQPSKKIVTIESAITNNRDIFSYLPNLKKLEISNPEFIDLFNQTNLRHLNDIKINMMTFLDSAMAMQNLTGFTQTLNHVVRIVFEKVTLETTSIIALNDAILNSNKNIGYCKFIDVYKSSDNAARFNEMRRNIERIYRKTIFFATCSYYWRHQSQERDEDGKKIKLDPIDKDLLILKLRQFLN